MEEKEKNIIESPQQNRIYVLFYSFFLVPLMIVIFGLVILLPTFNFLIREPATPTDLLNDVRFGSASKRWQSAFKLSGILSDSDISPKDNSFRNLLIDSYNKSIHDDYKVRMYLVLAMGRTKDAYYSDILVDALDDSSLEIRLAAIQSLGEIQSKSASDKIAEFISKSNSDPEILASVISLGKIGNKDHIPLLKNILTHDEANIRWDAAIALAKMGNNSGKDIINNLLNRNYYNSYKNVDKSEKNQAIMVAIQVCTQLNEPIFENNLKVLASSLEPNMEIRDAAIKVLKKIYNKEIANG